MADIIAVRGAKEISVFNCSGSGPVSVQRIVGFPVSRVMVFSSDGSLFAFCDGTGVHVHRCAGNAFTLLYTIPRYRTAGLQFSPRNSLLVTWEPFTGNVQPDDRPHENLELWDTKTGEIVHRCVQKKQFDWCPQWSKDEKICARNLNNEIVFYENNQFSRYVHKLHLAKITNFMLAERESEPYYIAVHVPGSKGQPSFVRVFQYPNFGGLQSSLASKSFYKAETADLLWNKKGSALLIHTATESSAASYYGEQGLHFVDTRGESCLVPRAKEGPVYTAVWNPQSTEFCVVYGCMPAKATLYNLKCEPVFDFGTGPRNLAYYNPHGNVLCLAGFGNLRGNVEMWDVSGTRRLISTLQASDSTHFEWCADGKHFLTATTSPRLRIGNGFKIWNLYGSQLYATTPTNDELYEIIWKPSPEGAFPTPEIVHTKATSSASSVTAPQQQQPQPKAYVPPALRGQPQLASKSRYKEAYELDTTTKQSLAEQKEPSKAALKNKKKREAKARKKLEEAQRAAEGGDVGGLSAQLQNAKVSDDSD